MKESVDERIKIVKGTDDLEVLKEHLCPFFQLGSYPACMACRQSEDTVQECQEYYLSRISIVPMDIWSEEFDRFIVQERNKIPMKEVAGIGINCDSCYMSDKCPMHKPGFICAIDWEGDVPSTPEGFYGFLVDLQFERVKRASVFEKIDGGVPDAGLSGEMDRLSGLVAAKMDVGREKLSISVETSTPGSGGGILAQLFGAKPAPTPIEMPKETLAIEESVVVESTPKEREPRKRKTK